MSVPEPTAPRIEVARALRVLEETVHALSVETTREAREAIQRTLTAAAPDLAVLALTDPRTWRTRIAEVAALPGTRWVASVKKLVETQAGDMRPKHNRRSDMPEIQVSNRQAIDVVEEAWRALLRANTPPELYVRGTDIVRLRRAQGRATISMCGEADIQARLMRSSKWLTVSEADGRVTNAGAPPMYVAKDMLVEPSKDLPELNSVVYGPVWSRDGQLMWEPGYHEKGGVWYEASSPLSRCEMTVEEAKGLFQDWLTDFPFAEDKGSSRTHALALFLTPFVRRMIDGPTPIHLIEAAKEGTGKTKLADTLLIPATGRIPQHSPLSADEGERQKKITSMLAAGVQIAFFDNVTGLLVSPSMDIAVTSMEWTDRVLGGSIEITVPVNCVWVVTGNNLEASADTARRILPSRLVRDADVPADFDKFEHPNIEAWTMQNRERLVSAAVALVENWIAKGSPKASKRLGSFESYCDVVGGILEVAGYKGWLGNVEEFRENANPQAAEWIEFVKRWASDRLAHEGAKTYNATALAKFAAADPGKQRVELFEWMGAKSGTEKGKASALGRAVAGKKDAVIAGWKIQSKKENGAGVYWLVEAKAAVSTKPEVPTQTPDPPQAPSSTHAETEPKLAADRKPAAWSKVKAPDPDPSPVYTSYTVDPDDDGGPLF